MSKQTLIMKESALSENIKISSLTQEVIRLSKNTSEDVSLETRVAIIDDFQHRLELSGYSLQASRRILVSGLQGYERIKRLAAKTGGYINRPARMGEEGRRLKKLLGKSNWFKKKRKKQQEEGPNQRGRKKTNGQKDKPPPRVTSVLFVPKTRHSELQRRLQRCEEQLSLLGTGVVRQAEQTGTTVRLLLQRNNPWGGLPCSQAGSTGPNGDQVGCLPCSGDNETKQSCEKRSLVYETTCLDCDQMSKTLEARGEVGLTYRYCGTTSGGMRRRGGQHLADLKAGLEGKLDEGKTSHMLHHIRASHPGENPRPRWGMKMIKTYSTTFKRLLAELVHIKYLAKNPKIELLNQKCGGYQGYQLPRLSVQWGQEGGPAAPTQETGPASSSKKRDLSFRGNISIPVLATKKARAKVKYKTT